MEDGGSLARSVLECGSLLPLWNVQGLNQKVEEKETRLQELTRSWNPKPPRSAFENAELQQRLERIEKLITENNGGVK